ncbi:titin homolog isoform X2 [Zingiber officinale]|uniref:titin homolog isoform X1 n=1 Tax=Zingiber officinale TaxID=94328 RepID=UPI001C4B3030|nr:titin homolog isoform X1 [Zingiber officinale]XP_042383398.1 titin homolog isoform X2 [Zingiber officinale]
MAEDKPPPEGNTRVYVDSEEQDMKHKSDTVEDTTILNGSGPLEPKNVVSDSGDTGNKGEGNKDEDGKEMHIEENGTAKENDIGESKEDDTIEDAGHMQKESSVEELKEDNPIGDAKPVQKESSIEESKENSTIEDARPMQKESSIEESKEDKPIEDAKPVQKESGIEESKEDDPIEDARLVQKGSTVEESEEDTIEDGRPVRKEITIEESKDDDQIESADTTATENDVQETKDKKEIEDTIATAEDMEMVDEEGDQAMEHATTTTTQTNDVEESKEDIKNEDPSTAESKDGKKIDVEGDNITVANHGKIFVMEGDKKIAGEDVEMADAEDDKNVGVEKEEKGVEQEAKQVESKNYMEVEENGSTDQKDNEDKDAVGFKRKRSRVEKTERKGSESATKAMELLNSPITSSIERPVRQRKSVERLVEVIENEALREFQVEKGRGTPLKDIPSVAHKLAKKKPDDIKLIHHTLFGRRGKAVNFKHHILQFSGFVWHESDEKQRAKMKEKLDKYVKESLLDLCDLFDLPASKANSRKEELVEKLLDFLVAPYPNIEQSTKSKKRERAAKGSSSKRMDGAHSKRSRKKANRDDSSLSEGDKSLPEMNDEDEVNDNNPRKGKAIELSESEDDEKETYDMIEEDEHQKEDLGKGDTNKKRVSKQREKVGTDSKVESVSATTKGSTKPSSSILAKTKDGDDDLGAKVFSRKKKMSDSPKNKSTIRSAKNEKDTGKKAGKDNVAKSKVQQPGKEELRKKVCEILKEVDFNTATFTDILKLLATHYKVDLTSRKASIKLIIQEELTKLAEAEEEDDED